ncbi:MAG: hypothetical protein AAF215_31520 [Cyanobacteria bacterium P01_A01_bin.123]
MDAIVAITFVVGVFVLWFRQLRSQRHSRAWRTKTQSRSAIKPQNIARLDSLTRDRATSVRLVRQVKQRNHGRSNNWCAEKAIYDLERDRLS